MTQNYFKGQITVVFPATQNSPLYGKILPVWGNKTNKGDQINFNMFALRENKKFPEEGGACEIDFKDTVRWTRKQNGNVEFYTPNVPFIVYFKIKATQQRDGSSKLVAVSIYSEDKIDLSSKLIADGITRQPSLKELLGEKKISPIEALELSLYAPVAPRPVQQAKKVSKTVDRTTDIDYDDDGSLLEAAMEAEYESQQYQNHYAPVDNLEDDDEEYEEETVEEEEEIVDEDEYNDLYEQAHALKKFRENYEK